MISHIESCSYFSFRLLFLLLPLCGSQYFRHVLLLGVAGVMHFPFSQGDLFSASVLHVLFVHLSSLPERMPFCFANRIITLLLNQSIHLEIIKQYQSFYLPLVPSLYPVFSLVSSEVHLFSIHSTNEPSSEHCTFSSQAEPRYFATGTIEYG